MVASQEDFGVCLSARTQYRVPGMSRRDVITVYIERRAFGMRVSEH